MHFRSAVVAVVVAADVTVAVIVFVVVDVFIVIFLVPSSSFRLPRFVFLVTSSSFRLFSARFPSAFSVRFSLADPLIFRLTFPDFRLSFDRLTLSDAVGNHESDRRQRRNILSGAVTPAPPKTACRILMPNSSRKVVTSVPEDRSLLGKI